MKQTKLSQQQRAILTCILAHVQESYPDPGIVNECNLLGTQIQGIEKFLSILDIRLDKVKTAIALLATLTNQARAPASLGA